MTFYLPAAVRRATFTGIWHRPPDATDYRGTREDPAKAASAERARGPAAIRRGTIWPVGPQRACKAMGDKTMKAWMILALAGGLLSARGKKEKTAAAAPGS